MTGVAVALDAAAVVESAIERPQSHLNPPPAACGGHLSTGGGNQTRWTGQRSHRESFASADAAAAFSDAAATRRTKSSHRDSGGDWSAGGSGDLMTRAASPWQLRLRQRRP